MAERRRWRSRADDPIRGERAGHFRLKDIKLFLGDIGEGAFGYAEILCEYGIRDVREKVGNQEGLVFVEVAIVEDQQELRPLALESLERVWDAAGKVPDVTFAQIIQKGMTVLVDRSDPHPAFDHEAPLV